MCKCTPEIRTPWCGKVGCEIPGEIERLEQQVEFFRNKATERGDLLEQVSKKLALYEEVVSNLLSELTDEVKRGEMKDCIGCLNGSDLPEEELCRACWRIWSSGKPYLLWDYRVTMLRIDKARQALEQAKGV